MAEDKTIRVEPQKPPEKKYRVLGAIPFHPVSGGGPFKVGDIICADSFPVRQYSDWRLRNLVATGKIQEE